MKTGAKPTPPSPEPFPARRWAPVALIAALWLVATFANVNKAFHIDDTAYIEVARHIAAQPLHPFSGTINWGGCDPEPISTINQPLLFPALIALCSAVFGESEIPLHLMLSLFTLAALVFFYLLATEFAPRRAMLLTALFGLSAPFVVGQNLMTDVPLTAAWTAFFWALTTRNIRRDATRYALAGALCAVALMLKYNSLALLPALFLHPVLRRRGRHAAWVLIPLAVLAAWSAFNIFDYGSVHLLDRPVGSMSLGARLTQASNWLLVLGAIGTFSLVFYAGAMAAFEEKARRIAQAMLAIATFVFFGVAPAYYFQAVPKPIAINILATLFMINGAATAWMVLRASIKMFEDRDRDAGRLMLHYWFWAGTGFVILFAPFMAVRHLLTVLPALLLLLGARWAGPAPAPWRAAAVAMTILLTAGVAWADWQFANIYRKYAPALAQKVPAGRDLWYTGHWGWQYYAQRARIKQLTGSRPEARPGDYIVSPDLNQPLYFLPEDIEITKVAEYPIWTTPPWAPAVSHASFYATTPPLLPWHVSSDPIEVIVFWRVDKNPYCGQ